MLIKNDFDEYIAMLDVTAIALTGLFYFLLNTLNLCKVYNEILKEKALNVNLGIPELIIFILFIILIILLKNERFFQMIICLQMVKVFWIMILLDKYPLCRGACIILSVIFIISFLFFILFEILGNKLKKANVYSKFSYIIMFWLIILKLIAFVTLNIHLLYFALFP